MLLADISNSFTHLPNHSTVLANLNTIHCLIKDRAVSLKLGDVRRVHFCFAEAFGNEEIRPSPSWSQFILAMKYFAAKDLSIDFT